MSKSLIDLSSDDRLQPVAEVVQAVQAQIGDTPILLVGATARDILLTYAHGIPIARATSDIDFALATETWQTFETVKENLIKSGEFTASKTKQHRLLYKNSLPVDIIPFDGVEGVNRHIEWPPAQEITMNVLGFREAIQLAVIVRLPNDTVINVISLPAFMVVKLIAWSERSRNSPGKDAYDLYLVLKNYIDAGNQTRFYEYFANTEVSDDGIFDYQQAGARMLGADTRIVLSQPANEETITAIAKILEPEIDPAGNLRLASEMDRYETARALGLLQEFHKGFKENR